MKIRSSFTVFAALAIVAGCAANVMPEAPEGQMLFAENCASCHGVSGRGDGEFSAQLNPRPADLTKISARNGGSFPTAKVLSMIDGYKRDGAVGQEMPEFGLLLEGETVPVDTNDGKFTPTPRPLAALLAYLESIQE